MTSASAKRIIAMVLRHWYYYRGSWPRLLDLTWAPTMGVMVWGFLSSYIQKQTLSPTLGVTVLVGAVLLWDGLVRIQIAFVAGLLEELFVRSLGHLFASPLTEREWAGALLLLSLILAAIGILPAGFVATALYGYVPAGGLLFAGLVANLIVVGMSCGLLFGSLILRYGRPASVAQNFGMSLLNPLSAVFYPVSALPSWIQPVSLILPTTHVFEGLRALPQDGARAATELLIACALNVLLIIFAVGFFVRSCNAVREKGSTLATL
jgi:ABC-2 type transport system permease protein